MLRQSCKEKERERSVQHVCENYNAQKWPGIAPCQYKGRTGARKVLQSPVEDGSFKNEVYIYGDHGTGCSKVAGNSEV